jgi:osmotically inducible lipoprotein OsmB
MNKTVFTQSVFTERHHQSTQSSRTKKRNAAIVSIALMLSLNGCTTMSSRDKNMAVGAGVGAVTGAILTGGSSWGTVGGAAVGGVIGNQIGR